jgi:hypothetical protein
VTVAGADGAVLTASGTNDQPTTSGARSWWWRHNQRHGNLGDALNLVVLEAFGVTAHRTLSPVTSSAPTPTLLAIGSTVSDRIVADRHARCVVWGSGWRGEQVSDATRDLLDVRAVRGPHTAAALGVTGQVPMGDPALLLPRIIDANAHRSSSRSSGRAILVPHISHISGAPEVGCDQTVTVGVRQAGLTGRFTTTDMVRRVRTIANAGFVLTGALHAAIIAQAYGVPWAPWRGPDVDCPAKWDDWAAYLGIELQFAPDRAAGERWWADHGSTGLVGDLTGLTEAFPYDALGLLAPASPGPVTLLSSPRRRGWPLAWLPQ